jgi:hypothetical protein
VCELAIALAGRRTVTAFGIAHGVKLPVRNKGTDHTGSAHLVSLHAIREGLKAKVPAANEALKRLKEVNKTVAGLLIEGGIQVPPAIESNGRCACMRLDELLAECESWYRHSEDDDPPIKPRSKTKQQPTLWPQSALY